MCENVENYKDTKLIFFDEKISKLQQQKKVKNINKLENEADEFGAYEVISKKNKILDSKAHHVGVAILQYSKLLFLR